MSNRANLCKAAAVAVKKLLDIYHVNYPTVWVDSKTKLREIACILNADHWNTDFTERFDVEACVKELKERYGVAPTVAVLGASKAGSRMSLKNVRHSFIRN